MGQNVSTAVMQRRVEAHDSLDDFPTPPWATRALCQHVIWSSGSGWPKTLKQQTAWEPACNRGHMAKPLAEYFCSVLATDIHDYGWEGQRATSDFLFPGGVEPDVDWIITNPPFRLAEQFVAKARDVAKVGCAVIVRSAFLESIGRYDNLFRLNPPSVIAQFTERVVMVKGRLDPIGSTATAYCWLVWTKGATDTRFTWIPPCRKALERASDYTSQEAAE